MRKEGFDDIFISKDAKVNAVLLIFIALIFVKNFNKKINRIYPIYINYRYIFKGNSLTPLVMGVNWYNENSYTYTYV